jgi:hypothetical protein
VIRQTLRSAAIQALGPPAQPGIALPAHILQNAVDRLGSCQRFAKQGGDALLHNRRHNGFIKRNSFKMPCAGRLDRILEAVPHLSSP